MTAFVRVDPECLREYAARCHIIADDIESGEPPEVVAQPDQATAAAVLVLHGRVAAARADLAVTARGYGVSCTNAAAEYVSTDAEGAQMLAGVPWP